MRITGVSPTAAATDSLISSLDFIHVGDNNRSQGNGFFFQQRQIELDDRIAKLHALTFFSNTLEAFASAQRCRYNRSERTAFNAAIGFDRERMVGFKDFADGTNRATILLPVGLIAMPLPTIFSAKTTSGTPSMLTIRQRAGQ